MADKQLGVFLILVVALVALLVALFYNPISLPPEYPEYQERLRELTVENQRLSNELVNISTRVSELRKQLEVVNTTLTKENQDLKYSVERQENQLIELKTQCGVNTTTIKHLIAKFEDLTQENQNLRTTLKSLENQLNEIKKWQCSTTLYQELLQENQRLRKELAEIQAFINKLESTSLEAVDAFVRQYPIGWTAEQMAKELQEKFFLEIRIRQVDNVKFLFVRIKCCGNWYWVTYQGLRNITECPIVSNLNDP